jgi:hypothetical protein
LWAARPAEAWTQAARAAIRAERRGLYGEARDWSLLTEVLGKHAGSPEPAFDLAYVKARVALNANPSRSHRVLLEAAKSLAADPRQHLRIKILEAEYTLREGEVRKALAASLRVGTEARTIPALGARALLVAVHARVTLREPMEARRELARARTMIEEADHARLRLQADNWEAELAWHGRDLAKCITLCDQNIKVAQKLGMVRGEAFALSRKAAVLRLRGRRPEAEQLARSACDAFSSTGDIRLDVASRLSLAALEAERGDLVSARNGLDMALRHIQGLHLEHLLPTAMRIALRIAAARMDPSDAQVPLDVLTQQPDIDDEGPAARVRWWKTRGDATRALEVSAPADPGYGRALWHLERARTHLGIGDDEAAREDASYAIVVATTGSFAELGLYARLVLDGLTNPPENRWNDLQRRAAASPWVALSLAALDLDARRRTSLDPEAANRAWRTLAARAHELGYRADAEDAVAWLGNSR